MADCLLEQPGYCAQVFDDVADTRGSRIDEACCILDDVRRGKRVIERFT
eukprot:COSAG04_NODE_3077_length_3191_cov_48.002264_2_plen_49_part_00